MVPQQKKPNPGALEQVQLSVARDSFLTPRPWRLCSDPGASTPALLAQSPLRVGPKTVSALHFNAMGSGRCGASSFPFLCQWGRRA